ncbi:hypothetical protein MRB53_016750 [Persea americana]|uniref:Uncharacterized protein n=1 Tax=Persea americana TaxID=3435 RepID=A0ACC2M3Z7_PERAE|nr:hypothetical protein MRB53_016750 [Persea americana]
MPPAVECLARKYLRDHVVVTIGTVGKRTNLITQHVTMVHESEKIPRLQKMLNELSDKSAIVFINNRKSADTLSKALDKAGYRVTTLHGGKSPNQREINLEAFRSKRFTLLVTMDVMGHGIDIPDFAHVINYDMPGSRRIQICSRRRRRRTTILLAHRGSKTLLIRYRCCAVTD